MEVLALQIVFACSANLMRKMQNTMYNGVFLHWASPNKLAKLGKPRLGESTLT